MQHKHAFEALDRTMKDLKENNHIMGGTTLLLSGDFRQTLPIIPRGTPADEINACIKSSFLWKRIEICQLQTNMRVRLSGNQEDLNFAAYLLQLGNGSTNISNNGEIRFPPFIANNVKALDELVTTAYPNLQSNYRNSSWLFERAILAPKNDSVNATNERLLNNIPGEFREYRSIDSVSEEDDAVIFPLDFLHSFEPIGMPPHILNLKIGCPIMLLRNLDAPRLCNGTRLCVKQLLGNLIEAEILTGKAKGEYVYIPRVPLKSNPDGMCFQFKRLQFPVRACFGMTINKSQGQSLKVAGLDLSSPCFYHGQLYVACSRVGLPKDLFSLAPGGKTKNIVCPAAFN